MGEPEAETVKKPSSNRSTKERRNTLFRVLDGVLSLSHKKIHNGSLPSTARCYTAVYQDKPIAFLAVVIIRMRAAYYRVSRLVVLPDYQGIGVGKRLLNFIAELYTSQTKMPFYILTGNPQVIRGNMANWKVTRFGHAGIGRGNTRINNEIRGSLSRKRITVSLQYSSKKSAIH